MKKKYYAIKNGRIPGIYETWNEAKEQVEGFSGAVYKSFSTLKDAEKYMSSENALKIESTEIQDSESLNQEVENKIKLLQKDEAIAFVDGSYDVTAEVSGFGAILISYGGSKELNYKSFNKRLGEEFIKLRNVAAELEGVKEAIKWAVVSKKKRITIYYDYEGIEKWANGEWRAKKRLTREYVKFIQEKKRMLDIEFVKVPAHSGIKLNEEADALAKSSLLSKGHKTYEDGSVYFVGYKVEDWKAIIDFINEENNELISNKDVDVINFNVEDLGTRKKVICTYLNDKVTINCYRGFKSYVQGKQSVLFQKVISTGISFLSSEENALETLNTYYALNISKGEAERYFDKYLPNYKGATTEKIYLNLLSAIYNTMLTGYMPDYTCLLMPIFRAYEFCLHRILGDKMGLITENEKGKNIFTYFSKDDKGVYYCNNGNINRITDNQKDFLNNLYTKYNGVRHIYSHWSAEDSDVAMISDITQAREYILEGLTIVNEYYRIF